GHVGKVAWGTSVYPLIRSICFIIAKRYVFKTSSCGTMRRMERMMSLGRTHTPIQSRIIISLTNYS
ncbi:MAG: hypothetical protein IJP82_07690, partial [Bacteroidaceae bacterium]|nr:hypothetical protein [Bacteroidaceae bacterium]